MLLVRKLGAFSDFSESVIQMPDERSIIAKASDTILAFRHANILGLLQKEEENATLA